MTERNENDKLKVKKSKKQKHKKNRAKNREIRIVTWFFTILMLAVMWNIVSFVKNDSEEAINNSYNPRQEILASQNYRGNIYSADGDVLAATVVAADGSESRIYPYQNLFAHVVGYSVKGRTGIEASENMNMIYSHASLPNKIQNELNESKNYGDNVITTLDVNLQKVAYDALGVYSGAVIVSKPSTGEILAMLSKPDFDPNEIGSLWDSLINDKESTVLLNRATQGLYPPGSTFKIVTSLAYYRQMQGDVSGYSFTCNGRFTKDGSTINCYHGTKHGSEDFTKSFAKSCNSSFANIGLQIDADTFQKTCDDLLLGKELNTSLVYSKSSVTRSLTDTTDDIMQTAIGQGKTQMTPLSLHLITSAIANDGTAMTPYVVDRVESVTGSVVKKTTPHKEAKMMTLEEAAFLRQLMSEVVTSGTGTKLSGLSYTAAGKTGSAEFNSNKADSHAWFTGFAPVEDPQVAVTVIVESAGSGGDYAVPIVKRILNAYFDGDSSGY